MMYLRPHYLLPFLLLLGCGTEQHVESESEAHLKKLAVGYGRYIRKYGKTPRNGKALKDFLKTLKKEKSAALIVDNVEKLFHSPRDNQPYVVNYGLKQQGIPNPHRPPIIAYEKQGKKGKRLVAFITTEVREVEEAEFQELLKAK